MGAAGEGESWGNISEDNAQLCPHLTLLPTGFPDLKKVLRCSGSKSCFVIQTVYIPPIVG